MKRRVGFIGLGDQGAPMAAALAERHDLYVWARRDAAYAEIADASFQRAESPERLARRVDILCLCLPGDAELEDILFTRGVAAALPAGSVVINHATGDPEAAARTSDVLSRLGVGFLDAPVSGGRPGALERTLTCFVGGDPQVLGACQSVIACHSQTVAFMGAAGSGQMTKLINNALTVSNLRNVSEAFHLAEAAGVNLPALQAALANSSGGSFILQAIGGKIGPDVAEHIAALNRKDVQEFADAMTTRGLDAQALVNWATPGPDFLVKLVKSLSREIA